VLGSHALLSPRQGELAVRAPSQASALHTGSTVDNAEGQQQDQAERTMEAKAAAGVLVCSQQQNLPGMMALLKRHHVMAWHAWCWFV
jgi:hypothetical protein